MLYVIATRIRFMCPMHFNKFPMDTQTCKFQVVKMLNHNSEMTAFLDSETLKYAFFCFCFMVDCNILVYSYCQIPFIWQLPLPLDFYIFCKCHDMRFTKLSAFTFQLFPDNSHIFSHTLHWMNKTLGNLCRSLVFSCHSRPLSQVSQKLKQKKCPVYQLTTAGPI